MSWEAATIRPGTVADASAIGTVHCAAARAGYASIFPANAPKPTPQSLSRVWAEMLAEPDTMVFVAHREEVVGAVALRHDLSVPATWLFTKLYVHPGHWGGGIGRRLHDVAVEKALDRGVPTLSLWVLEHNGRARAMYERWGWVHVPGPTLANTDNSIVDVLYERHVG